LIESSIFEAPIAPNYHQSEKFEDDDHPSDGELDHTNLKWKAYGLMRKQFTRIDRQRNA
jgi:hypothetical protein